jgi:hypothetical protein
MNVWTVLAMTKSKRPSTFHAIAMTRQPRAPE